jgi:hypothetical protein
MAEHALITLSNTTALRLTPLGTHSGMDFTLQNVNASGYIYIGGEGVTSENYGFRILPNHSVSFELPPKDALFAISSVDAMKLAKITMGLEVQD